MFFARFNYFCCIIATNIDNWATFHSVSEIHNLYVNNWLMFLSGLYFTGTSESKNEGHYCYCFMFTLWLNNNVKCANICGPREVAVNFEVSHYDNLKHLRMFFNARVRTRTCIHVHENMLYNVRRTHSLHVTSRLLFVSYVSLHFADVNTHGE